MTTLERQKRLVEAEMINGKRLAERRRKQKLTQGKIADALGIKPASVSGWERGAAQPATKHPSQLAGILGVSVGWILSENTFDSQDHQPADSHITSPKISPTMRDRRFAKAHRARSPDRSDVSRW